MESHAEEAKGGSEVRIFVRFQHSGLHNWPDAPAHRSYLREMHRHNFHFEVSTAIGYSRQIEFHDLLGSVKAFVYDILKEPTSMSCEEIAEELGKTLAEQFEQQMLVICSEDGECGAEVIAHPPTLDNIPF